jgi:tape measure domain-containing protein
MLGGEIKVVMTLDNGQFTIQTQKAGQVVQQLQRTLDQTARSTQALEQRFTGLYGRFQDVVKTASLLRYALHDIQDIFAALPGAILKSSGEIERMTLLMEGLSKQTDMAAKRAEALSNVKFVFDMAQRNPFDVKALTDSFVKFKSAGLDPTNGSLQALVDSVARFGGTSEALKRASIAIQQMAGKGVISMEELRQQLGEAVPNAINMMADGAGMSMAKFTKLVSTGTVEASTSLNNMFAVMKFQNDGAAAAMMQSWTGMLALLSTKFELFKKEVGDNAFFQESKKQLQDIIDLFGQPQAKAFANELGQGLTEIVRAVRTVIEAIVEWWDVIKLAGQAFLAYFAITKIQAMFGAIRAAFMGKIALYQGDVTAQRAALAEKLNVINQEIAAERQRYANKVTAMNAATVAEQKAHREQAEAQSRAHLQMASKLQKRVQDEAQHYSQLQALHQRHLMQKMQAELAAESAMRQKKAGSAAAAREYTAEAQRLGINANAIGGELDKQRQKVQELEAARIKMLELAQASRMSTVANTQQAASAAAAGAHAREMARMLQTQASAATAAATGVTFLGRAMSGLSVVFNAFGGWVGLAIAALVTLGTKLYEYMNRWEEFRKAVDRTKKGIASEEDLKNLTSRSDEAKKSIENLSKAIAQIDEDPKGIRAVSRAKGAGFGNPDGTARVDEYRASMKKQLDEQIAIYADAQRGLNEQKRLILEDSISTENQQYQRTFERGALEQLRNFQEGATRLTKAEEDALKTARDEAAKKGKKLTQSEEEALRKRYIDARNVLVQEEAQYRLKYALEKEKTLSEMLVIERDPKKLEILKAQRDFVAQQIQAARDRIVGASNLGKTNTAIKDQKPKLREDPLVRMAEELEAAVLIAKSKFQDALTEGKSLKALRDQVAVEVFGDMAAGKFDTKEMNADGEMVPNFLGGKDARKNYAQQYTDFVAAGKGGVEEFIATLTKLDNKGEILKRIRQLIDKRNFEEGASAIMEARQIGIDATNQLTDVTNNLTDEALNREDAALNSIIKRFEKLDEKVRDTGVGYQAFIRIRDKAISDATSARNLEVTNKLREDNKKYVEEVMQGTERSRIQRLKGLMDYRQLAKAQYDEEVRDFETKEQRQRTEITKRFARGSIDFAEYQRLMNDLEAAGQARRAEMWNRYLENAKSALQKLADEWQNSVNAMNVATANWANQFMDAIVEATTGGTVEWRKMLAGWAKELYAIFLKRTIGSAITGMFGKVGGFLSDALGLGGTRGESPDKPMYVQDVSIGIGKKASEEGVFKTIKDKLTDTWAQLKTGLSNVWDKLKGGFDSVMGWLKDGMGSLMNGLSSFLSGGGGGFGGLLGGLFGGLGFFNDAGGLEVLGSLGFAKGGIMTGSGPMRLKRYAMGGIATSPQLAMFGEGSTPEAYVPLPDGRSIPVSMTAPVTNNAGTAVYITINVDESGQAQESSGSGDAQVWNAMAVRVKGVVMEELVKQQRPGGVLYR